MVGAVIDTWGKKNPIDSWEKFNDKLCQFLGDKEIALELTNIAKKTYLKMNNLNMEYYYGTN